MKIRLIFSSSFFMVILTTRCNDSVGKEMSGMVTSEKIPLLFMNGANLFYTEFDQNGVETGRETWEIEFVHISGDSAFGEAVIYDEQLLHTGLEEYNRGYFFINYSRIHNQFYIDLGNYVSGALRVKEKSDLFKSEEFLRRETKLLYPEKMNAGQRLPDGKIELLPRDSAKKIPVTKVVNRIVEKNDTCKTLAGVWKCSKISFEVQSIGQYSDNLIYKSSAMEWYNSEVGIVRIEYYNQEGKMISRTELTKVSKN